MKKVNTPRKVYPLTLPFRLISALPGILFVLAPIFISISEGSAFKNWHVYVFFFVIGGILIYYGLTTFLITSAEGVKNYFLFPFYFNFSWKDIEDIYLEDTGIVYLFWNVDEKKWFHKRLGGRLQLSLFVSDWGKNELIHQMRTHATQLEIGEKILVQPKHAVWQHFETMIFYYVMCLFVSFPLAFTSNMYILEPVRVTLVAACLGFIGGTIGGMIALLPYNEALKKRSNQRFENEIRKLGMWNYILPFSGWTIGFILGLLFQLLFIGWRSHFTRAQALLNSIVMFVTIIVQILFLPYMTYNRPRKNVFPR